MWVSECPMASFKTHRKDTKGVVHVEASSRKVTQLESAARVKDARHLEEIEELRAIARNEHESLETMIQTLEQQLQQ